ncbi:key lime pathogenicity [Cordyceps militaris]|uniref:Key lime pathogenicity n=1 Tax=Cordyceps militaris TaxID=73501 RepID=A0A2H4SS45_CORMI|nr:key lime pathogenicity [Cordyceps militaris]
MDYYSPDATSFTQQPELSMLESYTTPSFCTPEELTMALIQSRDNFPTTTSIDWPSVTPEVIPRTESFSAEDMRVVDFGYANVSEATASPVEYVRIETPPQSWSPQSAPETRSHGYPAVRPMRRSCSGHERVADRSRRALYESIERGRHQRLMISPWLRGPPSPRFQRAVSGPPSKPSKSRKREDKIQCELCPAQLSGDHESARHFKLIHAPEGWRWQILDPAEKGLTPYFRIPVEIMDCKNCQSKKLYGINYNAAAHIRRVHFKNASKAGAKGGSSGGTWPEIRYLEFLYMKLVHVQQISGNTDKPKENIDYVRTGREQATVLREPHSKRHSSVPAHVLPDTHAAAAASYYLNLMAHSPETHASPPYYDECLPYTAAGGTWQPSPPSYITRLSLQQQPSPRDSHESI